MAFYVGQKVVCVDNTPYVPNAPIFEIPLKVGATYTVRWTGEFHGYPALRLAEFNRPVAGIATGKVTPDMPIWQWRFRATEEIEMETHCVAQTTS